MSTPPQTLEEQLLLEGAQIEAADNEYHPMLSIIDIMMGYKPKVNGLVKLWPPGFRTFHLLFKNSTNMPMSMMGNPPLIRDLFLAMYASSRETGCEYCTAHTVAAGLRRGVLPETITCSGVTEKDRALFEMSKALAKTNSELNEEHILEMQKHYSQEDIEWVALSIGLMGFLNLLTSAFGLILEDTPLEESAPLLGESGWKPGMHSPKDYEMPTEFRLPQQDKLSTYISMARYAPYAMYHETLWVAGCPSSWPKAGRFLEKKTGHNFPLLSRMQQFRATMSYTAIIRDHFDPEQSSIGLLAKSLVGLVYASRTNNAIIALEAKKLAYLFAGQNQEEGSTSSSSLCELTLNEVSKMATENPPATSEECAELLQRLTSLPGIGSRKTAAALILAQSSSTRPTVVSPIVVSEVASLLTPAEKVETVIWVGLQQCFQRMYQFYEVRESVEKSFHKDIDLDKIKGCQSSDNASSCATSDTSVGTVSDAKGKRKNVLMRLFTFGKTRSSAARVQ